MAYGSGEALTVPAGRWVYTHHSQRIHNNGINMRAALLIRDLSDLTLNNKRPQSNFDVVEDARGVPDGIDKENRVFCKGRYLAVDRAPADLGRDGEVLAALGHFTLD